MNLSESLKNLNSQQRLAVETIEGPVMVIAGPGTGKTQVLALRIAYILQTTDVKAENILCLTFTEAGVKAMRDRLSKFIGKDAYHVGIYTFHGFANDIIQTFPDKFAFSKNLQQLDDLSKIKLIRSIIDELPLKKYRPFHDPYNYQSQLLQGIQTLKKEGISAELFSERIQYMLEEHDLKNKKPEKPSKTWLSEKEKIENQYEMLEIYKRYQELLSEQGYYDYEDMILFVIEQMKTDDSLLAYLQEQYLYIHVDEYQDTNGAQNEIITLLGSFDSSPNIFVVGDDDQAIYRFQGANLDNILYFGTHFENVIKIPTPVNYRSSQLILDLADSLIANNQQRLINTYTDLEKKLKKGFKDSPEQKAELWECENSDIELIQIANEINKIHEKGIAYKDIAVLYRKNKHGEDIARACKKLGIPTQLKASESIFEMIAIQQLLLLLRTIYLFDKAIDVDVYHLMLSEFTGIANVSAWKTNIAARQSRTSLFIYLLNQLEKDSVIPEKIEMNFENNLPEKIDPSISQFIKKIFEWHTDSFNMHMSEFLEKVLTESNLLTYFNQGEENFYNILGINAFYEYVKQQEQINPEIRLEELLHDITLIKEQNLDISIPTIQRNDDAVQLLTVHSSKGLEYEYVFITRLTENNWEKQKLFAKAVLPQIYSPLLTKEIEKSAITEDERRLLFVAITRAKQKLYFTFAKEYSQDNNTTQTSPSMFVQELNEKLYEKKIFEIDSATSNSLVNKLHYVNPVVYSEDEQAYLREQVQNFKLSVSALNTYLRSPLEFKESYLLRIPQVKEKQMVLGVAIHAALEQFNRQLQQNIMISESDMLEIFTKRLKKDFYGFEEYEATVEEGLQILTNYYHGVLINEKDEPAEIEYTFSRNHLWLEIPGEEPIRIEGRMDKIEYIDKDLNEVRVVDYKTSKPKSKNEILGQTKNATGDEWRQMVFYKILGDTDDYFRKDRSIKNSKYKIKEACIEFLRPSPSKVFKKESVPITDQDADVLKQIIYDVIKRIRNLEFPEVVPKELITLAKPLKET